MRATQAIIHLELLKKNIAAVKTYLSPNTRICMAVKADAYGHGAVKVIETARKEGVGFFGIATISEAVEIRQAGIHAPLILFSLPLPEEIPAIIEYGIIPFAADSTFIDLIEQEAARRKKTVEVHVKIDTGMGRIGCTPDAAIGLCEKITRTQHVRLAGVCTHFPGADCDEEDFTKKQIAMFNGTVEAIRKRGIDPGMVHAANSAGLLKFPEAQFDLVRPGIVLYGYSPFPTDSGLKPVFPVMTFESRIVFLKKVPAGFSISYGMTYKTRVPTVIGTVAAGYADGYPRSLSNKGTVLINGRQYPIAGRICMDQFMVDLGPAPDVHLYDTVSLFGPDPAGISAQAIADTTGTIPYEILCGISKRVPRVYL